MTDIQHKMVQGLLGFEGDTPDVMTLTESGQIVPEHSTAALVVHHSQARYF